MMLQQFWQYYKQADTQYSIHSPFVFQLLQEVLVSNKTYGDFVPLEHLRFRLQHNTTELQVTDLGAGSRVDKGQTRSIKSIAKNAVSPKWQCQFLFRLIDWLQPQNRLEIGTSLGVNTLYQYLPIRQSPLITLEGCPNIGAVAQKHFEQLKATNIELKIGDFTDTLPQALEQLGRLDYVLIDGNHQKQPTIDYFEQCLAYSHNDTILVLDDIHWSEEMQSAWQTIKQHSKVTLTLDFFYFGLVFLRQEQKEVEHFSIIPTKYKPWKVALL